MIIKYNLESKVSLNFENSINSKFISHIFNLELRYLKNKRIGEIIRRINDMSYIKNWFLSIFITLHIDLLLFIVSLIIMFLLSFKMTIIVVISIILNLIIMFITINKIYRKENIIVDLYNRYNGDLNEYLEGIESIKNLNKENIFLSTLNNDYYNYTKSTYDLGLINSKIANIGDFISTLTFITFITYALTNPLIFTLVDLVLFNTLYQILANSLKNLISLIPIFIHVKTVYRDISEFLDVKEENGGKELSGDVKCIDIKNLSYSYDYLHNSIENINLTINKNDKILLKGESGVGKSTLAKVIAGIYSDYSGSILLNDVELKNINKSFLRDRILYVGQNERLFKGTIKDNITLGVQDDGYLETVINMTLVKDILNKRADNINSLILENGSNLSGGEKARIILARALFKKPDIIIIDETLSGTSELQENIIIENMLASQITLLYITHRNKGDYFDRIIDLKKGSKNEIIRK